MPPTMRRQSGSSSANLFRVFLFTIVGVLVVLITASLFVTYGGDKQGGSLRIQPNEHISQPLLNKVEIFKPHPAEDVSLAKELVDNLSMKKPKIAYAITVTKDGSFLDGALVLGYAARKYHDASKGYPSAFDVDLVAFVAPSVVSSIPTLEKYGWKVLRRELPVRIDEIQNQDYAQKMKNSGCCGADEFLKLWAYTLTDYHRVVHLDMDSIVFKNMDEIYQIDKEFLFTGDYNMKGNGKYPPVQGGFLVVKPSMQTFEDFKEIIRRGNHGPKGWEGSHIGNFWGGQTIQGIMPYYYNILHPERALELNRCEYNCMVDNPYRPNTLKCQDGKATCQDCRLQTPEKVSSAHFTICQKPWTCTYHNNPRNMALCKVFHAKWFQLRDEFEKELGVDLSYRATNSPFKESLGMCKSYGDSKYLPIPVVV